MVAGAALLAAVAFAAGFLASRRDQVDGPSAGEPVVALDAGAVDLGPGRPLTVDWLALAPPSAPLPAPGSAAPLTTASTQPPPAPPPGASAPPPAPAR